ncbi:MAG TPA: S9 family peptidase [Candidatus Bacteroides merdipullorum]|uniref:S9 family peptidase n=1 Tax=Candidatus Bacteroides merdipullorum TaxID=2838474 RepID=A0A9D2CWC3_9BACE|nr:S9 family peptidase [Candidatus Bacteroides merdipullorum]
MKLLTKTLCALLLGAPALLMAQSNTASPASDLKMPTLEDLIPGGETYRYTENLYGLQWWGDTAMKPGIDSLVAIRPKDGRESLLFTRDDVNRVLEAEGLGKLSQLYVLSFPWADKTQALFPLHGKFITYDWTAQTIVSVRETDAKAANVDYNSTSGHVAYTLDNNLYVDGQAVTREPAGVVCGQTVHRNEFGISKGTFWSPTGTLLAFYRMDERMVTEYPLVDITARVGQVDPVRYPMAGMTSHRVQVGIYNPATGQTVYLETGDPTDRYFTNISWSPDERSLFLIELNRDQNHAKLCRYDAGTGQMLEVLYEEEHPKYVEPQTPIVFLPWDPTKFLLQSQQDGWNHLYLFDLKKKKAPESFATVLGGKFVVSYECVQLTRGAWLVQSLLGFNEKKKEIYFTATKESPMQSNIYKVRARGGDPVLVDQGEGVHNAQLSASGTYVIDNYSTPDIPRAIDLLSTATGAAGAHRLFTAPDPFRGLVMPTVEVGTMKAADDTTTLYWRMLKPADFDPQKKYPVIVYVYGGPHAQMLAANWMYAARGWDLYMANRGYILFTIDNRGSSNRGLAFENCTFRHLGVEEGRDQAKAAEWLKTLPYVDGDRIGVHGWSFGGHMTTALMLRYPTLYKVGVAGGPVIDWRYYEVMYGERYMDRPQTNPDGYAECDLKTLAGQLRGKLLLIHDDHDDTCVPQHTLSFLKACVDARTYPDLFIYPCHKHNVMGRDRVHLHEKITRYFDDYLR